MAAKDGGIVIVQLEGRRFETGAGGLPVYEVFVQDVTERRVLEQQFQQAQIGTAEQLNSGTFFPRTRQLDSARAETFGERTSDTVHAVRHDHEVIVNCLPKLADFGHVLSETQLVNRNAQDSLTPSRSSDVEREDALEMCEPHNYAVRRGERHRNMDTVLSDVREHTAAPNCLIGAGVESTFGNPLELPWGSDSTKHLLRLFEFVAHLS
jgi:hypothetical protein